MSITVAPVWPGMYLATDGESTGRGLTKESAIAALKTSPECSICHHCHGKEIKHEGE